MSRRRKKGSRKPNPPAYGAFSILREAGRLRTEEPRALRAARAAAALGLSVEAVAKTVAGRG